MLLHILHGQTQLSLAVFTALNHRNHLGGNHHIRQLLCPGGALGLLVCGIGVVAVRNLPVGHQHTNSVDLTDVKAAQFHCFSPFYPLIV